MSVGLGWSMKTSRFRVVPLALTAGGVLLVCIPCLWLSCRHDYNPRLPYQKARLMTESYMKCARAALDMFEVDCGRYPTEREGLCVLWTNACIFNWRGPYILGKPGTVHDGWGHAIVYRYADGQPVLISRGPDGAMGTADDIQMRIGTVSLQHAGTDDSKSAEPVGERGCVSTNDK